MSKFDIQNTKHTFDVWCQLSNDGHGLSGVSFVRMKGLQESNRVEWEYVFRAGLFLNKPDTELIGVLRFVMGNQYFSAEEFLLSVLAPYFRENSDILAFESKFNKVLPMRNVDPEAYLWAELLSRT